MSDETTNSEPSPVTSSASDRAVPGRRSNRIALVALTISFAINVALWGSLIYCFWKSVSLYMAVGRCAVFVTFMAGVHFIGYRLWQRQFVQNRGDSNESPSRPISSAYWPAIKTALLQQGIVLVLALLILDMGATMCAAQTAVAAYWVAFGIVVVRRPSLPTRGDMFLIRYGFLLMFLFALAALPFVARALGRW